MPRAKGRSGRTRCLLPIGRELPSLRRRKCVAVRILELYLAWRAALPPLHHSPRCTLSGSLLVPLRGAPMQGERICGFGSVMRCDAMRCHVLPPIRPLTSAQKCRREVVWQPRSQAKRKQLAACTLPALASPSQHFASSRVACFHSAPSPESFNNAVRCRRASLPYARDGEKTRNGAMRLQNAHVKQSCNPKEGRREKRCLSVLQLGCKCVCVEEQKRKWREA